MERYNILVWAEDIGSFIKDYLNRDLLKGKDIIKVDKLFILGETLKISDFKLLNDAISTPYILDREVSKERYLSEIFLLGKCVEHNEANNLTDGLITYKPFSKEASEVAKNVGIVLQQWNQIFKNKPTTAKKQETISTKKQTPVIEEKKEEQVVSPKRKTSKSLTSKKTSSSLLKELESLINKSSIKEDVKKYYLNTDRLQNLEIAVRNASDENIGLPFQLKMYFGESGELILELLKKHFKMLKKIEE